MKVEEFRHMMMCDTRPSGEEDIDTIDVRYHASGGQQSRKPLNQEHVEAIFRHLEEEAMAKVDVGSYNGGITAIDFGLMKLPLPVPEKGMKWAMRWHDTPSGELLPELAQVPLAEPNSDWKEGYPKYD